MSFFRNPIFWLSIPLCAVLGFFIYWFFLPPQIIYPPTPLETPLLVNSDKPLTLVFDRPFSRVIQASISPSVTGHWQPSNRWFPRRYIFTPNQSLDYDTEYVVSVDKILPVGWIKLSQTKSYLFVFSTPPDPNPTPVLPSPTTTINPTPTPLASHIKLDVPLYKQHYTFTCYSTAAKMALAYRQVKIDEVGFLDEIGYDTTPRNYALNVWGDPNQGVVGTYTGKGVGGYGVHWQPVAKAMSRYRQIEVKEQWNLTSLLETVAAGNPVMVWWVNGVWPAKDISWNNTQGDKVYTVNGMHVEVVTGFDGTPQNPEKIFTNDPWRGYRQYTPESFQALWKWFNQTALVVY